MSETGPPAEPPGDYAARFGFNRRRLSELLTRNLPAAGQDGLAESGDHTITGILLRTWAIIGTPG